MIECGLKRYIFGRYFAVFLRVEGVDFRQSRKSTPSTLRKPSEQRPCGQSEAIFFQEITFSRQ